MLSSRTFSLRLTVCADCMNLSLLSSGALVAVMACPIQDLDLASSQPE